MEDGGKGQDEWTDYGDRVLYSTPRKRMLMEPLGNFKNEIKIYVTARELWSSGKRVESRRLFKRPLMAEG